MRIRAQGQGEGVALCGDRELSNRVVLELAVGDRCTGDQTPVRPGLDLGQSLEVLLDTLSGLDTLAGARVRADDPETIPFDVQSFDIDLLIVLNQLKSVREIRVIVLGEHPRGLRLEP
jgi:hypothetical protein